MPLDLDQGYLGLKRAILSVVPWHWSVVIQFIGRALMEQGLRVTDVWSVRAGGANWPQGHGPAGDPNFSIAVRPALSTLGLLRGQRAGWKLVAEAWEGTIHGLSVFEHTCGG